MNIELSDVVFIKGEPLSVSITVNGQRVWFELYTDGSGIKVVESLSDIKVLQAAVLGLSMFKDEIRHKSKLKLSQLG